MKSIEDPGDADYGARVLAAARKQGLSTSQWSFAAIQAMEAASRLEFLELFKRHDRTVHYALIELIRTGAPEAFVERVAADRKASELFALFPLLFGGL
jgi:hypothetical protein